MPVQLKSFCRLKSKWRLKTVVVWWQRGQCIVCLIFGCIIGRKMMDSGQLDFFQHDKVCTNTCRSTKFDLLISSARAPVPSQQSNVIQTPTTIEGKCNAAVMH